MFWRHISEEFFKRDWYKQILQIVLWIVSDAFVWEVSIFFSSVVCLSWYSKQSWHSPNDTELKHNKVINADGALEDLDHMRSLKYDILKWTLPFKSSFKCFTCFSF